MFQSHRTNRRLKKPIQFIIIQYYRLYPYKDIVIEITSGVFTLL